MRWAEYSHHARNFNGVLVWGWWLVVVEHWINGLRVG